MEKRRKTPTGIDNVFYKTCMLSFQHVASISFCMNYLHLINKESLQGESISPRLKRCQLPGVSRKGNTFD